MPLCSLGAAAVTRLAAYLDDHNVPVDYHRRRRLDYSGLLPPRQWLDLCRRTGIPPGQGRQDKIVRCMLFARISGLPVESAPDFGIFGEAYFRAETACFAAVRTPELAAALDETARDFLARHRIRDEPVVWHPPVSLIGDLDLPGPDPSVIDVTRLHELVRGRRHAAEHAAGPLGTTVDAVRLVLDEHRRCGTDRADALSEFGLNPGHGITVPRRRSRAKLNPPGQRDAPGSGSQLDGPARQRLARNGRGGSGPRELLAQSHFRDQAHRIRAVLMADDEQAQ